MKKINIPSQEVTLYEFKDLAEHIQSRMIITRIQSDIETGFYTDDSLYLEAIEECNNLRTPWFYGQVVYDKGRDSIAKAFQEEGMWYTKAGNPVCLEKDKLSVYPGFTLNTEEIPVSQFTREIKVYPARDNGAKGGKSCAMIWFILKGPAGVVTVSLQTSWWLPHTTKELVEYVQKPDNNLSLERRMQLFFSLQSMAYSTHIVASEATLEKDGRPRAGCNWLDGQPCEGDTSYLSADKYRDALVEKGSEAVWELLEKAYDEDILHITYEEDEVDDDLGNSVAD